jgi:hypothetical protein
MKTTKARVMDLETSSVLSGSPTAELCEQSEAAGPTGAVSAYEEAGEWHYVAPSDVDRHVRHLGCDVVTVYVEAVRS